MAVNKSIAAFIKRLPPVRWFRAAEDGLFRIASEVEYRLKITPRTTKIVPNSFDRRIVRLFLIVMPLLVASLFWDNRSQRLKALLIILLVAAVALAWIFVADAFPGKRRTAPPPSKRRP